MSAQARLSLGHVFFAGQIQKRDLKAAYLCFSLASSEDGTPDACFYTAWCLDRGHGVNCDLDKARLYYKESAESEFQLALAWCSLNEVHGFRELDDAEVLGIFSNEALDKESLCARMIRPFLLGEAHALGLFGLEQNPRAATACYQIAADRGLVDAEIALRAYRLSASSASATDANVSRGMPVTLSD